MNSDILFVTKKLDCYLSNFSFIFLYSLTSSSSTFFLQFAGEVLGKAISSIFVVG